MKNCTKSPKSKFRTSKIAKMTLFDNFNQCHFVLYSIYFIFIRQNLISRKIWMAGKLVISSILYLISVNLISRKILGRGQKECVFHQLYCLNSTKLVSHVSHKICGRKKCVIQLLYSVLSRFEKIDFIKIVPFLNIQMLGIVIFDTFQPSKIAQIH